MKTPTRWRRRLTIAPSERCSCHIFDMGPRCDFCVAKCTALGHPHTEDRTNGQHHMCGVIL